MFIGEFLCCLPLIWSQLARHYKEDKNGSLKDQVLWVLGRTPDERGQYQSLGASGDDIDEDGGEHGERHVMSDSLTGRRMLWMWFPAFFDSECDSTSPCADG